MMNARFNNDLIRKEELRKAISTLHYHAHFLYVFLRRMPKSYFTIYVDDDAREVGEELSFDEFLRHYDRIHPTEASCWFCYQAYVFRDDRDCWFPGWRESGYLLDGVESVSCTQSALVSRSLQYSRVAGVLKYWLRERILADNPFRLTPDVCREYGLTQQDYYLASSVVQEYNRRIIGELREDYRRLGAIGCLHE